MSSLVVANNVKSLNSYRALKVVSQRGEKTAEKLASGYKINRAGDDAAKLAISEKMRNQIKGLNMASKNAQDGISMIQTAEAAFAEVSEMIKRIRELTVQGANDTNTSADREKMADEIFELTAEIRATEDKTTFNGMKILKTVTENIKFDDTRDPKEVKNPQSIDGKFLQIGANENQSMTLNLNLTSLNCPYDLKKVSLLYATHSMLNHCGLALAAMKGDNYVLGTSYNYTGDDDPTGLNFGNEMNHGITKLTNQEWISRMIANADAAAGNITTVRTALGAYQNRLEHTIKNLDVASENLSAAESIIRDTDMAKEMTEYTKSNILSQVGLAMLAQANQDSNTVTSILR